MQPRIWMFTNRRLVLIRNCNENSTLETLVNWWVCGCGWVRVCHVDDEIVFDWRWEITMCISCTPVHLKSNGTKVNCSTHTRTHTHSHTNNNRIIEYVVMCAILPWLGPRSMNNNNILHFVCFRLGWLAGWCWVSCYTTTKWMLLSVCRKP